MDGPVKQSRNVAGRAGGTAPPAEKPEDAGDASARCVRARLHQGARKSVPRGGSGHSHYQLRKTAVDHGHLAPLMPRVNLKNRRTREPTRIACVVLPPIKPANLCRRANVRAQRPSAFWFQPPHWCHPGIYCRDPGGPHPNTNVGATMGPGNKPRPAPALRLMRVMRLMWTPPPPVPPHVPSVATPFRPTAAHRSASRPASRSPHRASRRSALRTSRRRPHAAPAGRLPCSPTAKNRIPPGISVPRDRPAMNRYKPLLQT
jgi:hypothetical protein